MKSSRVWLLLILAFVGHAVFAQKVCTSNPTTITTNITFGSIAWTASGGATVTECNQMADGLITFTGNVVMDLANTTTITITNNVNIDGDFLVSGGPGSKLSVSGARTLYVTGDLGNPANNGTQYEVINTLSRIVVDGTLYGKNNNAFTGAGTITGGTLDVKNGSTCGSPCPVSGGFSNCESGDGFCTTNNVVLPVTLLSFEGREIEGEVRLNWATIMEESFEKFVVERSSNGVIFDAIGEVPSAGRNIQNIKTEYGFNDVNPLIGFNYYRLKMVDIDEKFEYSPLKVVKSQSAKKFWVHPNPSIGSINYHTNFDAAEGDRIMLIDHMGKQLALAPAAEFKNLEILGSMKPGVYVLKYFTQDAQYSSRVILK